MRIFDPSEAAALRRGANPFAAPMSGQSRYVMQGMSPGAAAATRFEGRGGRVFENRCLVLEQVKALAGDVAFEAAHRFELGLVTSLLLR